MGSAEMGRVSAHVHGWTHGLKKFMFEYDLFGYVPSLITTKFSTWVSLLTTFTVIGMWVFTVAYTMYLWLCQPFSIQESQTYHDFDNTLVAPSLVTASSTTLMPLPVFGMSLMLGDGNMLTDPKWISIVFNQVTICGGNAAAKLSDTLLYSACSTINHESDTRSKNALCPDWARSVATGVLPLTAVNPCGAAQPFHVPRVAGTFDSLLEYSYITGTVNINFTALNNNASMLSNLYKGSLQLFLQYGYTTSNSLTSGHFPEMQPVTWSNRLGLYPGTTSKWEVLLRIRQVLFNSPWWNSPTLSSNALDYGVSANDVQLAYINTTIAKGASPWLPVAKVYLKIDDRDGQVTLSPFSTAFDLLAQWGGFLGILVLLGIPAVSFNEFLFERAAKRLISQGRIGFNEMTRVRKSHALHTAFSQPTSGVETSARLAQQEHRRGLKADGESGRRMSAWNLLRNATIEESARAARASSSGGSVTGTAPEEVDMPRRAQSVAVPRPAGADDGAERGSRGPSPASMRLPLTASDSARFAALRVSPMSGSGRFPASVAPVPPRPQPRPSSAVDILRTASPVTPPRASSSMEILRTESGHSITDQSRLLSLAEARSSGNGGGGRVGGPSPGPRSPVPYSPPRPTGSSVRGPGPVAESLEASGGAGTVLVGGRQGSAISLAGSYGGVTTDGEDAVSGLVGRVTEVLAEITAATSSSIQVHYDRDVFEDSDEDEMDFADVVRHCTSECSALFNLRKVVKLVQDDMTFMTCGVHSALPPMPAKRAGRASRWSRRVNPTEAQPASSPTSALKHVDNYASSSTDGLGHPIGASSVLLPLTRLALRSDSSTTSHVVKFLMSPRQSSFDAAAGGGGTGAASHGQAPLVPLPVPPSPAPLMNVANAAVAASRAAGRPLSALPPPPRGGFGGGSTAAAAPTSSRPDSGGMLVLDPSSGL